MANPIWKTIPGREKYEACDDGRVRRADNQKLVSLRHHTRGYLTCWINGKNATAHSLVAATFIGPRPEGMQVNHKDADKKNNRASNLEYTTRSGNMKHAHKMGLMNHDGRTKLTPEQVAEFAALKDTLGTKALADRFGISKGYASHLKNNTRRFKWLSTMVGKSKSTRPAKSP